MTVLLILMMIIILRAGLEVGEVRHPGALGLGVRCHEAHVPDAGDAANLRASLRPPVLTIP